MYTYDLTPPYTDLARVRFETRDNKGEAQAMFTDDEITFQVSEKGSWQAAVVALLEAKIAEIASTPDYTAQWLTVHFGTSLKALESLLATKKAEYGLAGAALGYGSVSLGIDDTTTFLRDVTRFQ